MKKTVFALLLGATVVISCSKEDVVTPQIPINNPIDTTTVTKQPGIISFSKWNASDIENKGNSSDIFIEYNITSPLTTIQELRLLISSTELTIEEAKQITTYQSLPIQQSYEKPIDINTLDSNNKTIIENQLYNLYVLSVFNDSEAESVLSQKIDITLKNEIFVSTPKLSGQFKATEDIAIGSDGSIYANGGSANPEAIYKVTPKGISTVYATGLKQPVGITIDDQDNLYASNFKNPVINKITPNGELSVYATDSRLSGGGGILINNQNELFNTFWASTTLFKIKDGLVSTFTSNTQFNGPVGVTYDKVKNKMYVSSFNNGKIFHVSNDGTLTEIADTPASIGHISYANDHFYVTGWKEHKVYVVSLDGKITHTIGTGSNSQFDGGASTAKFSQPNGIEATKDGKYVYVTQGNSILRKIIMPRSN